MASTTTDGLPGSAGPHGEPTGETRRDFLSLVTMSFAGLGTIAIAWTLVDLMNPSADVIAAGAPMDIDISKIEAGQEIIVRWRGDPILIVNRTPEALKALQEPSMIALLSDPNSTVDQQPSYAKNWHRSIKPEFLVLVGICTASWLPAAVPAAAQPDRSGGKLEGGYFCPCHGSKYDLAGHVYKNVPAPYNLPVPPYHFPDDKTLRIGENPTGVTFDLSEVVQL